MICPQRRNETVEPFGVSLHDMVQAISNLRDDLDGPQVRSVYYEQRINISK